MAVGGSQTGCRKGGSAEAQPWVFVLTKQVPWQELVPFGILAGVWMREMELASVFVPRQAELCQLITLAYNLPDVKSPLLSEHIPSSPSAFASQTRGSAWPVGCPSAPAPSRQSVERAPPRCPSYPLPWASCLRLAPETPFC